MNDTTSSEGDFSFFFSRLINMVEIRTYYGYQEEKTLIGFRSYSVELLRSLAALGNSSIGAARTPSARLPFADNFTYKVRLLIVQERNGDSPASISMSILYSILLLIGPTFANKDVRCFFSLFFLNIS